MIKIIVLIILHLITNIHIYICISVINNLMFPYLNGHYFNIKEVLYIKLGNI